jgi:hypothetical protein
MTELEEINALQLLKEQGLAPLPPAPFVHDFVDYLKDKKTRPGHVDDRPREGIWHFAMEDVMAAPGFLEMAKNLNRVASSYFEEPAILWSLNVYRTEPDTPHVRGITGLHQDGEAPKILTLFMLCGDTPPDAAQLFAPKHSDRPDRWYAMHGAAGTCWLADTSMPHLGLIPRDRTRTIAWARWANVLPAAAAGLPRIA